MAKVLIIGAGAAGLSAANELVGAGWEVRILEAQNRIGGRVHTLHGHWGVPIELGAEFLHGEDPGLWNWVRGAGLRTHKVPGQNWEVRDGGMRERPDLWKAYGQLIERVDMSGPDESFAAFLARQADVDGTTKAMVTDYVEGFNAADARVISVQALVKEEEAEESHATSRVSDGYGELMRYLLSQAQGHGAVIDLNTLVKRVRWEPGKVEVDCLTPEGSKTFSAEAVIITVPLGVLQGGGVAGITFVPELEDKKVAASRLEMGNVIKIILQFRSRFWPIENFGFIHDPGQMFPTWWSDERGPILTGWVGGRRAVPLLQQTPDMILVQALESLGCIFPVKQSEIRAGLEGYYVHNWADDPYSLGAYSYVPVGSIGVPGKLAEPVANTLFFAGEATAPDGEQGTVGSAIASGCRAAREARFRNGKGIEN